MTATTVATGAYPLTVRATGSGVTSDATLTLSVTNPVAGTWTFTNADLTEDGITNLQITFDGSLDAERVQITLNGTAVDLPVSLITGGASVDGSTVTIDVGLLGNDEIDFEGELDEARSSATGTMSYIIVGPDGARHDGGGAASITKGS